MEQPFLFGQPILTSTELYLRSQTIPQDENAYGGTQRFDFEMPYYTFVTLLRPFIGFDIAERKARFVPLTTSNEISIKVSSFTPGIGIELGSSKTDDISFENMKRAVIFGSTIASFCVEKFSLEGTRDLSHLKIKDRFNEFTRFSTFEPAEL